MAAFAPCPVGAGSAASGRGPAAGQGGFFVKLKESPLTIPKKNSGRDFDFPPRPPLKRPKERPAGLSFGNLSGGYGGFSVRRTVGRGTKVRGGVREVIQGFSPWGDEVVDSLVVLARRLGGYRPAGGRGTLGRGTKDERRGSGTPGRRALRGVRGVSSTTLGSGAQRSVCGGGGEGGVGIGVKCIPKGGKPATIAGGALSEAESAERGAGQIQGFAR